MEFSMRILVEPAKALSAYFYLSEMPTDQQG